LRWTHLLVVLALVGHDLVLRLLLFVCHTADFCVLVRVLKYIYRAKIMLQARFSSANVSNPMD
jgi:hypothetical protein